MLTINERFIKLDSRDCSLILRKRGYDVDLVYFGEYVRTAESFDTTVYTDRLPRPNMNRKVLSFGGLGDFGEHSVVIVNPDGTLAHDLRCVRAEAFDGEFDTANLPFAHDRGDTLVLTWEEPAQGIEIRQYFTAYDDCGAITTHTEISSAQGRLTVRRLMSAMLDLDGREYTLTNFTGTWARERHMTEHVLKEGVFVNRSNVGISSPHFNPGVVVTDAKSGTCYGLNLLYSADHATVCETSPYSRTRIMTGMSGEGFAYEMSAGERLVAPEAVLCVAPDLDTLSVRMHDFVLRHIIPKQWAYKPRPVLINSWEAAYFDFDEDKLVRIATQAAELGVELFVLDDGWFGARTSDRAGLGDWTPNRDRLPNGLKGLADKIRALGLKFGFWIEPEMVNPDSDLYRTHPEFAMTFDRKPPLQMRNQYLLDLANPEVTDYLYEVIAAQIRECNADYIKWDFNRYFTDAFSPVLRTQSAYTYHYVQGYYELLGRLTQTFPDVLFEGCAGGGARFDLGALCFVPQIWTSDNTDARHRLAIQEGTSVLYPQSTMGAHVSVCPNHITRDSNSIDTRFHVASVGAFGYELDPALLTEDETNAVMEQIVFYKKHRELLQFGTLHRLGSSKDALFGWITVAPDKSRAIAVVVATRHELETRQADFGFCGLAPDALYRVTARKQSNVSKPHAFTAYGDFLNTRSLVLPDLFEETDRDRNAGGLASRMYVIERIG